MLLIFEPKNFPAFLCIIAKAKTLYIIYSTIVLNITINHGCKTIEASNVQVKVQVYVKDSGLVAK